MWATENQNGAQRRQIRLRIDGKGGNTMRKRVAAGATVFAVALGITAAAGAGPGSTTHASTPISFTISADCPQLTSSVTAEGTFTETLHVSVDGNGVTHFTDETAAKGTATDTAGGSYVFNYHNSTSGKIPAGGFPFDVQQADHFNLVGNGGANNLHSHFVAVIHFESPTDISFVYKQVKGDPEHCDPI
jgi:hypothetical protein